MSETIMAPTEIQDGFYQVIIDDKDYIFRIRTHGADEKVRPGQQIIALAKKFGSRIFTNFGIIKDGRIARQFCTWTDPEYNNAVLAAANMVFGNTEKAGQLYARSFGRCYVCNRELSHPNSVATGIGPECAGKRNRFDPQEALAEYHRLKSVLDEERERSPVYEQWCRAGLHGPAPLMPVEQKIAHLDRLTHRHGFFFWHHWVDDGLGGEDSAYTIEEIKPTGMFDIERAEARFNEIQRMPKSTPDDVIDEQREIDHEAHLNGLAFEWNDPAQAFTCVQL